MFTDGLVERRSETIDDGLRRALETVDRTRHMSPQAMCASILEQMTDGYEPDDDIALLVIRRAVARISGDGRLFDRRDRRLGGGSSGSSPATELRRGPESDGAPTSAGARHGRERTGRSSIRDRASPTRSRTCRRDLENVSDSVLALDSTAFFKEVDISARFRFCCGARSTQFGPVASTLGTGSTL